MKTRTIWGIGTTVRTCGGHGDTYSETSIREQGSYGMDGFPPVFESREQAENHIRDNKEKLWSAIPVQLSLVVEEAA